MDVPRSENLRSFFERVKSAGIFERIFSWRSFVEASYDAYSEYRQLTGSLQEQEEKIRESAEQNRALARDLENLRSQLAQLQQDLGAERGQVRAVTDRIADKEKDRATLVEALANSEDEVLRLKGELIRLTSKNEEISQRINERENEAGGLVAADKKNQQAIAQLKEELSAAKGKYDQLNQQFIDAQTTLAGLRQKDGERIREHDARVTELIALKKQLEDDRLSVQRQREEEIHRRYEEMEQSWKTHEENVESSLRSICQRHTIGYCDKEKFPYAGKPDNAVIIADQYVIFDAKSPKDPEELSNFPQYIRTQAEAVKKYIKAENVKKEIFLVVPANTVEYLDEFHYDMADWQVYVVTHDCLEPVVLALRKIEDYQFVDQLSPGDRENICHVIGKFAHATKRRIQIDNYFSNEFIDLLQSCDQLPGEIREKVVEYEMAEKMNPPIEKRKKKIPIRELEHDVKVIKKEAEAREIDVTAVTKDKIETITLHKFLE